MLKNPPINFDRIDDMAEGDHEFKTELVFAIYSSLIELKEKYIEGANSKDEEIIQQIRHKIKPTLSMFDMEKLSTIVLSGKDLIAENGFNEDFSRHLDQFLNAVEETLEEVKVYKESLDK